MKVEYDLDASDLRAFFVHHARHAPHIVKRNRRMWWVWASILAVLVFIYGQVSLLFAAVSACAGAALLAVYGPLTRWFYVRHNCRLNAGPDGFRLGRMTLELDGDRLLVDGADGSSRLELSAIQRIEEGPSHYFLYLGPAAAIIVRKHGVDSVGEMIRALRSRCDAPGGGGEPPAEATSGP